MNTTTFQRDQTNFEAIRRRQALTHGIDSLRRAATAVLAARCGDSTGMRDTLLADVNRRIESMVRELRNLE
jgi:hypothetical protein